MSEKFSRRDFLRLATVTGTGALLAACGVPIAPPTPTSSPSKTATAFPTSAPTITAPETPPSAEIDIREMSKITAVGELLGVEGIITNVTTDLSLQDAIRGIAKDDSYKNFDEAMTEFTAQTVYGIAKRRGGPDGTGVKTDDGKVPTFEQYMQMLSEAQDGTRPYADVQLVQSLNLIETAGYEKVKTILWPFWIDKEGAEVPPEGVRVMSEFSIAFFKFDDKSVTNIDPLKPGVGVNLSGNVLFLYRSERTTAAYNTEFSYIYALVTGSDWLVNGTFPLNNNLNKLRIVSNGSDSSSSFRSVFNLILK